MPNKAFFLLSRKEQLRYQLHRVKRVMHTALARIRSRLSSGVTITPKQSHTIARKGELYDFLIDNQRVVFPVHESPVVTVLLIFWNRAELSLACLKSIAATVRVPYEVLIIDNHSTDETPMLLNRISNARIERNTENIGFLRACNQGSHLARGKHLLLLNNDTELHAGAVDKAVDTLQSSNDIGAVGGKIVLLDGTLQEAGSIMWSDGSCLGFGRGMSPQDPASMYRRDVDYCSGAFLLTPLALYHRIGGLDEIYAPAYYEETDYCARLLEQGLRIVYEPAAALTHYEFGSAGMTQNAIDQMRKNQSVFLERHEALLSQKFPPVPENIWRARTRNTKPNLLYIDDRIPHRYYGSGFPRSNDIVRALYEFGFNVSVVPYNFLNEEDWDEVYTDIPREVEVLVGVARHNLNDILANRRGLYEYVWVSRPHNMAHFIKSIDQSYLAGAEIIYDAEAVFALRHIAQQELVGEPLSEKAKKQLIEEELEFLAPAAAIVAVSDHERDIFIQSRNKRTQQVEVMGHVLEPDPTLAAFEERAGFLFVGNLDDCKSPNADSLFWFVDQVWPLIKKNLPEALLHVVGSAKSNLVQQLASDSVHILGRVDDVTEYYNRARVFIAPTRYAAGIPFKIHEACAKGLPCVASELVAEQTGWVSHGALVAASIKNPTIYAERCLALHNDTVLWHSIRDAGLTCVNRECHIGQYKTTLARLFPRLADDV